MTPSSGDRDHLDPLLLPLVDDQRVLVDLVSRPYLQAGQWPVRAYVEHEMHKRGLELANVVNSLPVIRPRYSTAAYRIVRSDELGQQGQDPIALTVAGFWHLPEPSRPFATYYIRCLAVMAEAFNDATLDPFEPDTLEVTAGSIAHAARLRNETMIAALPALLRSEPPTWTGHRNEGDPMWRWGLTPALRYFGQVADIPDYVARVRAYLDPPSDAPEPAYPASSRSLTEELDFLDAAWRLWQGGQLVTLPSAAIVAALERDAITLEEFDARLSALTEVLKGLRAGTANKHAVERLNDVLEAELGEDARARATRAVGVLRAVSPVRNAAQHTEARPRAIDALRSFGIAYPISDVCSAWQTIRGQVAGAIGAIREEVLAAHRDAPT